MYIVPQVLVYQDFEVIPAAVVAPLNACIVGPHYDLIRYAEADEKAKGSLGSYNPDADTAYLWPNRPAGGIVDTEWTKLHADDAWLKYWSNPSTVSVPSTGDKNRVTAASVNFVGYSTYALDASLEERDVQLGDGIRVVGSGGGNSYDILTRITGFENETVASAVGTAVADGDNQAAATAATNVTRSMPTGTDNDVEATLDGSAYDGSVDGYVSETYTVEVTTGGAPASARLKVTSASGTDNQSSVVPEAFESATAIGTRGLTSTFTLLGGGGGADTPQGEFIEGQKWVFEVTQDYAVPTIAEGGTYTGPSDTSYVVTVVEGGDLAGATDADKPKVSVATTTGIDFGGPYTVSDTVAVALGNYGVTITFTQDTTSELVKGDRFIVPATAEGDGAIRTLVLANVLPDDLVGEDVSIDLFIVKDIVVPLYQLGVTTLQNYGMSATEITVNQGIQVTDSSWYESATGDLLPVDLYQGNLYVEYRSLLQTYATHTHTWTLADLPDQVTPDNPLVYGAFKALSNSNGAPIKVAAVPTNDLDGYKAALEDIAGRDDTYGLVPLTWDREVQNLFAAHVDELSSAEAGLWRTCWLNSEAQQESPVYTSVDDNEYDNIDGTPLLATIVDDDQTSGSQFTKVIVDDGKFITQEVAPSDVVRCNYGVDANGETTYEEYVVDRVVSEDVLILVDGPSAAINVESKIEIWHPMTLNEVAQDYGQLSGTFGQRRVRHIWPDWVGDAGTNVKGYFLCCALSGLRSGVAPHQGLTNVEIAGFDDLARTTEYFGKPQLDIMAEAGTWIVTQDFETGQIYSRHQLTSADYSDQNQREDSITTNLDSISYYMQSLFAPFIGKANVTPEFVEKMRVQLTNGFSVFTQTLTETLGPQVIDYDIVEIRQHAVLRDRIVATVNLTLPFPFNNFELHLVV